MRLEAHVKMGYYACPPKTLEMICSCIEPETKGKQVRLLDPCAGQGEALTRLHQSLAAQQAKVVSYGVELSDTRATVAASVLDRCITGDWFDVACSHKSQSLLWVNPPYTHAAEQEGARKQRLEYLFLKDAIRTLQPNGLLVYIVPLHIFGQSNIARFVAGHFDNIRLYRLPAGEYEQYKQCVVFGTRKEKIAANAFAQNKLLDYANGYVQTPVLDDGVCTYQVPSVLVPEEKLIFRRISLHPDAVIEKIADQHNAHAKPEWQDIMARQGAGTFQPVVPLRIGHVASMISSGHDGYGQTREHAGQGSHHQDHRVCG